MFKFLILALLLALAAAGPLLPISPVITYNAGSIVPEYTSPLYYGSQVYAAPYAYNYVSGYRSFPVAL